MNLITFKFTQYLALAALYCLSALLIVQAAPPPLAPAIVYGKTFYRAVYREDYLRVRDYVIGSPPPPPLSSTAGDFARCGAMYTFTDFSHAVQWARHRSGFYPGVPPLPGMNKCDYAIVVMIMTCNPTQLLTHEFPADSTAFRN
ncbi:hypothetical protein CVT24_008394, partial [Panaeolus cyanescens]